MAGYKIVHGNGYRYDIPQDAAWQGRSWGVAIRARERARLSGHDMVPLEPDGGDDRLTGYISYCRKCDGFLVVDLIEDKHAYGRATEGPCPGKPPVQPVGPREGYYQRPILEDYPDGYSTCSWTYEEHEYVIKTVPLTPTLRLDDPRRGRKSILTLAREAR